MKRFLLAMVIGSLVVGCNPQRRIHMINDSTGDVEFSWKLKEADSLHNNPFFISNSDLVQFRLRPHAPYNRVHMSFGDGSWKRDTLKALTHTLEWLSITSAQGEIRLNNSDDIYRFLSGRRKGIGSRKIEIKITR